MLRFGYDFPSSVSAGDAVFIEHFRLDSATYIVFVT